MMMNLRSIFTISLLVVLFAFFAGGVWVAEVYAQEGAEEAKAKTASMMAKMDALGRAESFSSMADRTLSDLQTAAGSPNSNQIVYLARRYERLLEAARFNIFLADRQRKDTREVMNKVEDLSKKGTTVLKKISPEVPADARSAVERAEATSVKSRSILYQRLVDKSRVPSAAPSVPVTPEIPTAAKKLPVIPKIPTVPKVPAAPPGVPEPEVEKPIQPPTPPAVEAPVVTAPVVPVTPPATGEVVTVEAAGEEAVPPAEEKKSLWSRWFGK